MDSLLSVRNGSVTFKTVHALSDVDFDIAPGEVIAVVGESGCGKTTLGKVLVGLQKPTTGQVLFNGQDIHAMSKPSFLTYRRSVQMVMQDSYAALNPMRSVEQALTAPLRRLGILKRRKDARQHAVTLLESVGLFPGEQFLKKYPHQLSGGQRQRVCLARAISLRPKVIVADEPVSGVDVSSRISILKLMGNLNKQLGIAFVYITHDLSTARYIAENGKLAVMYLGRIVEFGKLQELLEHPRHPYLRALLAAVPLPDPEIAKNRGPLPLTGLDLPDQSNLPQGCAFHPRCPLADSDKCRTELPRLRMVGSSTQVSCHYSEVV
ncbi:MAG: ABC transporter ATP-binding protein [Alicyclobacillus sp.]|nr:ABC transporter ATP-binding protein [Alicyclobacillus sp.]